MSSLFCCSHHLWKAEASEPTGHMRRPNKPHRKGQRLKSLQNQVNVGEQRSNCFLFCFSFDKWKDSTQRHLDDAYSPLPPLRTVSKCQDCFNNACLHSFVSRSKGCVNSLMKLHPCNHFKWRCTLFWNSTFLFVQMSCALFKKSVFVFVLFFQFFYTLSSFLPPFLLAHHRPE